MKGRLWVFQSRLPDRDPVFNIDLYLTGELPDLRDRVRRQATAIRVEKEGYASNAQVYVPAVGLDGPTARDMGYLLSQAGWLADTLDRHYDRFPDSPTDVNQVGDIYQILSPGGVSYV